MRKTLFISISFLILAYDQGLASSFGGGGNAAVQTSIINQIAIDTGTTQMQVNALHLATATIFAGGATTYLNISGSTQTKAGGLILNGSSIVGGKAGIGTSNPLWKLHIFELANATKMEMQEGSPIHGNVINFHSANNNDGYIGQDGFGMANVLQDAMLMATWTSKPLLFFTNQNERMRINEVGNIGIGATTPSSKLDVFNGSITVRGINAGLRIVNLANPNQTFEVSGGTIALNDQILRLRGMNDANHGLGMFGLFRLWNGTDNVNGPVLFGNDGGRLGTHDMFSNTTTTELAWTSAGTVGIGTVQPSSKFEVVNGSITVRGTNAGINIKGGLSLSAPIDFGNNPSTGTLLMYRGSPVLNFRPIGNTNTFLGERTPELGGSSPAVFNTAVGFQSMFALSSGSGNTALGRDSLVDIANGNNNVAVGFRAGDNVIAGNNNTLIGYQADILPTNLTNAAAIGANASVSVSSAMVLGGTGTNSINVGIGTTAPSSKFDVVNGSITVRGTNAGLEVRGIIKGNSMMVDNGTIFSKIQAGTATIGSNGVSGVKTVTIIFPSAFSTAPKIIVTPRGENYADVFSVTTRNIGTGSFQVNVQRTDSGLSTWGQNLQMDWLAWE
jgi:hypothetical protein